MPAGMHSPWGIIGQMCEKHGWTLEYILEKVSLANIYLLMADKPRMVKRSEQIIKVHKKDLAKHRKKLKGNG